MTRDRVLWGIAITFALYAIYTQPADTGHAVHGVFGVLNQMVESIFAFFGAVIR